MKKRLAATTLVAIFLRLALLAEGEAAADWLKDKLGDELISANISFTIGAEPTDPGSELEAGTESESDMGFYASPNEIENPISSPPTVPTQEVTPSPEPETETLASEVDDGEILETTISGGLVIDNATSYEVDINSLLTEGLSLNLSPDAPQILIMHTHGSEAYTSDPANNYIVSGTNRTEDTNYNVVRVGDELAAALEEQGLNVLHDRELYDYPSYTGSYTRSGKAVESYLAQYPSIAIVIDLHRDALGSGDTVYKTVAHEGSRASSQLMMLVGTGENGLYHPYWQENLKLALTLQSAVVDSYPTLARPVALKQERYNQQLTTGSLILEVGSSGNTLPEALTAVRLFANAVGPVLSGLKSS